MKLVSKGSLTLTWRWSRLGSTSRETCRLEHVCGMKQRRWGVVCAGRHVRVGRHRVGGGTAHGAAHTGQGRRVGGQRRAVVVEGGGVTAQGGVGVMWGGARAVVLSLDGGGTLGTRVEGAGGVAVHRGRVAGQPWGTVRILAYSFPSDLLGVHPPWGTRVSPASVSIQAPFLLLLSSWRIVTAGAGCTGGAAVPLGAAAPLPVALPLPDPPPLTSGVESFGGVGGKLKGFEEEVAGPEEWPRGLGEGCESAPFPGAALKGEIQPVEWAWGTRDLLASHGWRALWKCGLQTWLEEPGKRREKIINEVLSTLFTDKKSRFSSNGSTGRYRWPTTVACTTHVLAADRQW